MSQQPTPEETQSTRPTVGALVTIAVGNTRSRVGSFTDKECLDPQSFVSSETDLIADRIQETLESLREQSDDEPTVVMSSVSPSHSDAIERAIRERSDVSVYRFGRDFQIPIQHTLTESGEMTVGQDRLLCAIGAFDTLKQACVVIDVGTAVTIDLVDGTGVFHGGAILPGISMMLESLHSTTSTLPKVVYQKLDESSKEPGKQTDHAINLGVTYAIRGAVRALTERYAEHYQGYPQTIVTGGDMGTLEGDELIDSFVPDLQLQGIRIACEQILAMEELDQDE